MCKDQYSSEAIPWQCWRCAVAARGVCGTRGRCCAARASRSCQPRCAQRPSALALLSCPGLRMFAPECSAERHMHKTGNLEALVRARVHVVAGAAWQRPASASCYEELLWSTTPHREHCPTAQVRTVAESSCAGQAPLAFWGALGFGMRYGLAREGHRYLLEHAGQPLQVCRRQRRVAVVSVGRGLPLQQQRVPRKACAARQGRSSAAPRLDVRCCVLGGSLSLP